MDTESRDQRIALVVTGMHRSGTSAMARLLGLLGAELPAHLIEGRPRDNRTGFWESRLVVDLNQRILFEHGSWWGGWQRIRLSAADQEACVTEAREVIRTEYGDARLIVLKDPRLSRLLPLWRQALRAEGYALRHIIAVRDPGDVASSLLKRNGLDVGVSTLSWLAHSLDAERFTRAEPRIFVEFDALLRNWHHEVRRITRALGVEWTHSVDQVDAEVRTFLDPDLVHNPSAADTTRVSAVATILKRWARDVVNPGDEAELQRWRRQLRFVRSQASPSGHVTHIRSTGAFHVPMAVLHESYALEAKTAWATIESLPAEPDDLPNETPVAPGAGTAKHDSLRIRLRRRVLRTLGEGNVDRLRRLRDRLRGGGPMEDLYPSPEHPGLAIERSQSNARALERPTVGSHAGPVFDEAAARVGRRLRKPGWDPTYDLVREHFDMTGYLFQDEQIIRDPGLDPIDVLLSQPTGSATPNVNFSAEAYLQRHPRTGDAAEEHPYVEWLKHGGTEGRLADPLPRLDQAARILGTTPVELASHAAAIRTDLQSRLRTGTLGEMFARAVELEPTIGQLWAETMRPRLVPFTEDLVVDHLAALHTTMELAHWRRARLVLVVNRPRWGGGRRVEGHIAHALMDRIDPDDIVVVYTDDTGRTSPNRFPEGVREIDLFSQVHGLDRAGARRVLVEFIRSLRADSVVNINSRLMHQALNAHGSALATSERIFLLFFCLEQTPAGTWVGLPLRYFYRLFDVVEGVLTDSQFLVDWFRTTYQLPEAFMDRLHVLRAPVEPDAPLSEAILPRSADRRPCVYWAGRWDRQKRVDIVIEVARRMPGVDFHVWGEPWLDGGEFASLPDNMELHGRYSHINDLDLDQADAWLYTSAWDGVPSLLLEVAVRGVPLVGSVAGGTGEVLVEDEAWPVRDIENVQAYVEALEDALADPTVARMRARALRDRMLQERSLEQYAATVASLLLLDQPRDAAQRKVIQ